MLGLILFKLRQHRSYLNALSVTQLSAVLSALYLRKINSTREIWVIIKSVFGERMTPLRETLKKHTLYFINTHT